MKTAQCDQCARKFEKPTQKSADWALFVHKKKKHKNGAADDTTTATPDGKGYAQCDKCGKKFQRATQDAAERALIGHMGRVHGRSANTNTVHVNYCPNCGTNLLAVATGLAMSGGGG
jgi:hypothetical protein